MQMTVLAGKPIESFGSMVISTEDRERLLAMGDVGDTAATEETQ